MLQLPRIAGPRIASPAKACEAPAKRARDARRQKRLRVVQSALGGSLARSIVQRQKPLPALAWRTVVRIGKQIGFGRQPQQCCHPWAAPVFDHCANKKQWVVEIRQFVRESLRCMHSTKRIAVAVVVLANDHCTSKNCLICRIVAKKLGKRVVGRKRLAHAKPAPALLRGGGAAAR
jgi:hypothetical protein